MTMNCGKCGVRMRRRKATLQKPYHYLESGLTNVFLVGIYIFVCPACAEEVPEIPGMAHLHNAIAKGLVTKPTLLDGSEIRFLRKNLRLKASEFAEFLDTTDVSVSRWETGEQEVGKENDKLIRYFYVRYKEETTKKLIKQALVERLRHIEREPRPLNLNVEISLRGMSAEFVERAEAA